ncbi:uncharacterized protein Dvir_GJ26119, isoform C [Drosophila virilis]|uniref:Uncharacterized protein, isoform C n=1 Tax=Drosophila virilis TaxID=7244 RepID=A0A0Q9WQ59_DROVI|nr:uncharacterized protein Dvir_GJ26119, isoform C [Drosophila virilis]
MKYGRSAIPNWYPTSFCVYKCGQATFQMKDSNIPRLHSTLVFIMDHFTIAELCSARLLKEFLAATNSPHLHDMEGINLPEQQMKTFFSKNTQKQLFKAFGEVAWHGVALCRWLNCIETCIKLQITKNLLLKMGL